MTFEIPYELQQAVSQKKLVVFTGAGVSIKEGLPSWKDLVLKILEEKNDFIEKSSFYADAVREDVLTPLEALDKIEDNKKHVFSVLEESVTSGNIESEFIQKLSKLTTRFITTNFDSLLEDNIPSIRKITKDSQYNLTKIDTEDSYVLKIHGDVSEIDNCVIFSSQYEELYSKDNLTVFQLKKIFSQYTVLFLGFSFSDHFVSELFDYVTKMLDGLGPKHFIITKQRLNNEWIQEIYINEHSDNDKYLDALLEKVNARKDTDQTPNYESCDKKILQTDGSDLPPSVLSWVGREREIAALNNKFKVYFITGIGGQGKSALAAHYLETVKTTKDFEIFDWRDFKEEGHKFESKIISMIMLVKNEQNKQHEYIGLDNNSLIDVFFDSLGNAPAIFVLDNVDSYIDLEEFEPLGGIGRLFSQAVSRNHSAKFIFTCRPFVRYASVDFFQLTLGGLEADDVLSYFNNSNLNINSTKIVEYAHSAHELTKGHPLWISLIIAQAKRGEKELSQFLSSITRNDVTDDDLSSIMSENILGKIWLSISEKHKLILRSLAESVQSLTLNDFFEIVSDELTYNKFTKSFRAVKNLGLIIEKAGGEYVELHPLVKEFIRKKYPSDERNKFIYMFIRYYDKVVLILKPKLSSRLSFDDFLNWTNKIELYANAKEYQEALDALFEIHDAIKSAGYIEEYLRVASIVFHAIPWNRRKIVNFNNFDRVYSNTIKSSIEYGDDDLNALLLSKYESIIENKEPAYIRISEARAYYEWFNGNYDAAIEICEKATFLLKSAKQSENLSLILYHALSLRDSGVKANMKKSLDIFLHGEDYSKAVNKSVLDKSLGGAFYGNLGRCLQFMNKNNDSLNCLCKSFILIYDGETGDRLLNLGYAGWWLSELLHTMGNIDAACYFYKYSIDAWESSSPSLYNKHTCDNKFDHKNSTIQSILNTDGWRVESYCNDWVREKLGIDKSNESESSGESAVEKKGDGGI